MARKMLGVSDLSELCSCRKSLVLFDFVLDVVRGVCGLVVLLSVLETNQPTYYSPTDLATVF